MKRISLTQPTLPDWTFFNTASFAFEDELQEEMFGVYDITVDMGHPVTMWNLLELYDEYYFDDGYNCEINPL